MDTVPKLDRTITEAEIREGYVRPLLTDITHTCGTTDQLAQHAAEHYARDPEFYGGAWCSSCKGYFPVGELGQFVWAGTQVKVGT